MGNRPTSADSDVRTLRHARALFRIATAMTADVLGGGIYGERVDDVDTEIFGHNLEVRGWCMDCDAAFTTCGCPAPSPSGQGAASG